MPMIPAAHVPPEAQMFASARPQARGAISPDSHTQTLLPLQGMTILAVEDSRFACEALRLMSMRAGARLRRAETLKDARAHLRVYRPDVVIIDLGLPDGRGEALIRALAVSAERPSVLLGTSGHPQGRAIALAAGADEFLDKPLASLAQFCDTLRLKLSDLASSPWSDTAITPDQLALMDDLAHDARSLDAGPDTLGYATAFLQGVAQHAGDTDLQQAADAAAARPATDLQLLRRLVHNRLATAAPDTFATDPAAKG